eukprot:11390331-Alexandrium_andersonii.AAC.1
MAEWTQCVANATNARQISCPALSWGSALHCCEFSRSCRKGNQCSPCLHTQSCRCGQACNCAHPHAHLPVPCTSEHMRKAVPVCARMLSKLATVE